jgi:cyclophilin family peptidyl-prolyl cis-trans isomerase/HEAT repeat protein
MNNALFSRGWLSLLLLCAIIGTASARVLVGGTPVKFSTDERRIITITDERRDPDSLLPYLTSNSIRVAWRAAIGIGNIGDTSIRPALLKYFLAEHRDSVADAEAFALGLLGTDEKTCQALTEATSRHPTAERLIAIARTATKADSASTAMIVGKLADEKKIGSLTEADAYVEFALHHEVSSRMMNDLDALANDDDPNVRWRAAYSFARADDSLDLAGRFPKIKDLLLDQGSPYVRMFAALALGKLHDAHADSALYRAYRGEDDWRVRVNILRAFVQFKTLDSLILSTLQLAVESALTDSALDRQVALADGDVIDAFVASGKLTGADSTALRNWLDGFNGIDGRHDEIDPFVCAYLTKPAVRLGTPTLYDAVKNYALFRDPITRNYAVLAAATRPDTGFFESILKTMSRFEPIEQVTRLEVLDSLWVLAKRIPDFRRALEANRLADLYRGLLIHISGAVYDPAVDAVALGALRDTSIIRDSTHRAEAIQQMEKYIPSFTNGHFRDALLAAVEDDSWLGDTSHTIVPALRLAYDSANGWGDNEVMDSIASLLKNIEGMNTVLPKKLPRVSHIDWAELESLPPNAIVNFPTGSILLRLLTDEAPLTVLNMVHLAREQWFEGITVHRVVPNFVIQAGDPSGTGWEGPGYTIRSEITPREYDREGMMGMARDGKDSESSQWFINECPTPHLDARYTIWAEVTSGMDEVCKRKTGDIMDSFNVFR